MNLENVKIKYILEDEFLIYLDWLTRFKNPIDNFLRVCEKIIVKNLTVLYGTNKEFKKGTAIRAIDDLSCEFLDGSINMIVGPSGSGKTTLLKTIAGLEYPYEGEIIVNKQDFSSLNIADKNIGYVSQEYVLYPHLTIFDNIAFPLKSRGLSNKDIIDKVYKISGELGLVACLTRKPRHLSGGQQQRVAIARALVKNPSLLLADEPTGNLDSNTSMEVLNLMQHIAREKKQTIVMVTHDNTLAEYGDKIIRIIDGKIVDLIDNREKAKQLYEATLKNTTNNH